MAGDAAEGVEEEGLVAGLVLAIVVFGVGLGFGRGFGSFGGGTFFLVPDSFFLGDSHKGVDSIWQCQIISQNQQGRRHS